jgi:hypothetical protein
MAFGGTNSLLIVSIDYMDKGFKLEPLETKYLLESTMRQTGDVSRFAFFILVSLRPKIALPPFLGYPAGILTGSII